MDEETIGEGAKETGRRPAPQGFDAAHDPSLNLDEFFCPECAYSLRGLASERCPECGFALGPLRSPVPLIPWCHRRERGAVRTYFATVRYVVSQWRRFRAEVIRPVSYADAQRFRWATILWVLLSAAIALGTVYVLNPSAIGYLAKYPEQAGGATVLFIAAVALWLVACTGVPSYLFHPRHLPIELQNRAIALSYYACAPLALLPLAWLSLALATAEYGRKEDLVVPLLQLLGGGLILGVLALWWADLIRLGRSILRRTHSVILIALLVPLFWLTLGLLIVVVLPFSVLYFIALLGTL